MTARIILSRVFFLCRCFGGGGGDISLRIEPLSVCVICLLRSRPKRLSAYDATDEVPKATPSGQDTVSKDVRCCTHKIREHSLERLSPPRPLGHTKHGTVCIYSSVEPHLMPSSSSKTKGLHPTLLNKTTVDGCFYCLVLEEYVSASMSSLLRCSSPL